MRKLVLSCLVVIGLLVTSSTSVFAQSSGAETLQETDFSEVFVDDVKPPRYKAYVIELDENGCIEENCVSYELEIIDGNLRGEVVSSQLSNIYGDVGELVLYEKGDLVYLQQLGSSEDPTYIILEPVREFPFFLLAVVFVMITIGVGRLNGFGALAGLGSSIFALFGVVTPMIISGQSPILAAYIGAGIILFTSIFFSHGINRKTVIAVISSLLGLMIITVFAIVFLELLSLNGFGDDASLEIISQLNRVIDIRGVLFASIIIGGVGVLDDITVNQVSAIEQIYLTDKTQTWQTLFQKSMKIGRDHIASLVNTLFIAYASSSLPLVALLQATDSTFLEIINSDQFAEEIIRATVGSIGLILVVPISSIIAAIYISKVKPEITKEEAEHLHVH